MKQHRIFWLKLCEYLAGDDLYNYATNADWRFLREYEHKD